MITSEVIMRGMSEEEVMRGGGDQKDMSEGR